MGRKGSRNKRNRRQYGDSDGLRYHSLYPAWHGMMMRCYDKGDKDYKNYGGRGIIVCPEWHHLANYVAWNVSQGWFGGDGLECDRRNNDGSYFPNNCRKVTEEVQAHNKRTQRLAHKDNKLGHMYIYWDEQRQKYHVRIKHISYGCFKTLEEAIARRDFILSLPSDKEWAKTKAADQIELARIMKKYDTTNA
jgi:hypothetical protein